MKFALLILSNFKRHKLRTALTILSIVVAFVLFGYLAAIRKAFEMGATVAGADRLVVRHKVSIIQMLPQSYEADIERIAGVENATSSTWFGGIYQDEKNFFAQVAVEPDEYLGMFPEFVVPAEQKAAWLKTRTGVIVGRKLADRFGFKVGDKVPIRGTIWRPKGGDVWTFDVVGIYDGAEKETDTTQMFLRYDYLEENRPFGSGFVGWYHMRIKDPSHAADVAKQVDALFLNSPAETKT
jgi:putative ABC transport system permease protein